MQLTPTFTINKNIIIRNYFLLAQINPEVQNIKTIDLSIYTFIVGMRPIRSETNLSSNSGAGVDKVFNRYLTILFDISFSDRLIRITKRITMRAIKKRRHVGWWVDKALHETRTQCREVA